MDVNDWLANYFAFAGDDRRREGEDDLNDLNELKNPVKMMILVSQLHRRKLERLVGETGLHRAQHRMLMTLSEHEFDSQLELARMLQISTATVAVSLKKLEQDGYIEREAKAADNRANFIRLTGKGKQVVESSREIFENIERQVVKDFSEEEIGLLRNYLKRMYDNLSEIE